MALQMAATVCWCTLIVREELMNIRETTPADFFHTFLALSMELLDILMKGALTFGHAVKRQRAGKCAGAPAGLCSKVRSL